MKEAILTIGGIIIYIFVAAMAIFEFASAAEYFDKKKWGWFGFSAYLAIYWMSWTICHSFG